MNWIKKNPAQFSLALIAVLLLAGAFMVFSSVAQFSTDVVAKPPTSSKLSNLPKVDETAKKIEESTALITTPEVWHSSPEKGSLFVSKQFVLKDNSVLETPIDGVLNPPVPNNWLIKYELDFTTSTTLDVDSDGDGFSNLLEFFGKDGLSHLSMTVPQTPVKGADGKDLPADSTNPMDAKDHPDYFTRVQVSNIVSIPFRLRFMSYDMLKGKLDTVAVNAMDAGGRTFFGKIGDMIPNTKYKLEKFEFKEKPGSDGTKTDVSELTVVNTETGTVVPLVLNQVVNSPESYMSLRYLWVAPGGQPTPDMNKKKGDTFTLPPEKDKTYKILDIKPESQNAAGQVTSGKVTIELPSKQTIVLPFPATK